MNLREHYYQSIMHRSKDTNNHSMRIPVWHFVYNAASCIFISCKPQQQYFVMPCSFFRQLSILFVTTISFTNSKDLRLRVDKLDMHSLDGDGTESPTNFDSGMAHDWGEVSKANSQESPEILLTNSGTCSTGSNQKPEKRRRSDAWCEVEQKKSPVQQQVNQGPDKSEGHQIEENVNWAPKWDILKYGTPADMYCTEDDAQRVLVCAQDMDWRDLNLPDGTPLTFPTTIEWCSPCKLTLAEIAKV